LQFLMKMLHIRERRRALVPTIIEGETGVGKTRLLGVYAAVEAAAADYTFRAPELMHAAFESALKPYVGSSAIVRGLTTKKFDTEMRNHPMTVSAILGSCVWAVAEVRHHEPRFLRKVLDMFRSALEGPLYWNPLFNPRQLLFYMRALLVPPVGEASTLTLDAFCQVHQVSFEETGGRLRVLWKAASALGSDTAEGIFMEPESSLLKSLDVITRTLFAKLLGPERPAGDDDPLPEDLTPMCAFARWSLAWLLVQPVPTFHTILMHAAYTVDDLRRELLPVVDYAHRAAACYSEAGTARALEVYTKAGGTLEAGQRLLGVVGGHYDGAWPASCPTFVQFLDEVNTSSIMGSVQDVMMDHSLGGDPLPSNIFWVCATNPYKAKASVADCGDASGGHSFRDHYQVRPVPEAMESVKWQFGALTEEAEKDYIGAKLREMSQEGAEMSQEGAAAEEEELFPYSVDTCPTCKTPHWTCLHCKLERFPPEVAPMFCRHQAAAVARAVTHDDMCLSERDSGCMAGVISAAQCFVRAQEGSSAVSQRDLHRVFKACRFFWDHFAAEGL